MHDRLALCVRRWLISPVRACINLPHSAHGHIGPAEALLVEQVSLCEQHAFSEPPRSCSVIFSCSCSVMNHTAPQCSIVGTCFPVGDVDVKTYEGPGPGHYLSKSKQPKQNKANVKFFPQNLKCRCKITPILTINMFFENSKYSTTFLAILGRSGIKYNANYLLNN